MNAGFDAAEIAQLKAECKEENQSFVYVEDEFEMDDANDEHAHVQFVGVHNGAEVIYDALIYTLRLHHMALVYDQALEKVQKHIPGYLPPDERPLEAEMDPETEEEAELLLSEFIEEMEENEEVKVKEHIEVDTEFDFGIGLEVGLNREQIGDREISEFIARFNNGTLELDQQVYSFHTDEEDEE